MNSLTFIFKLCLFLIIAPGVMASQQAPLAVDEYFSQTWDTRDGLPHSGINALIQSKDGYLWIGTWEGLARFNGVEFKLYTRGSETGLPDSAIKSLATRANGDLLVAGARGGLSERKNQTWYPRAAASTLVNHAIYDNNQGIWIGLEEKGLVYRANNSDQDTIIIADLRVYRLVQDANNIIWAATDKGLYSVTEDKDVTYYGPQVGLTDAPAHAVMITRQNQLIVGTDKGAYIYINSRFRLLAPNLGSQAILSLLQDSNDDIWLGTTNHGLFRLSENGLEQLGNDKGLPNERILSLLEDNESSIWIGTSAGLLRLREAPFITLTTDQGLAGDYVRTVLSHSEGSLWVGSSKGLSKVTGKQIVNIETTKAAGDISVLSLAEGAQGEVLVGSYTQGVFKVVNNQLVADDKLNASLPSLEVRSLLVDSQNNTWIGTTAGLVKYSHSGELNYFYQHSGLPANFIMALAEDQLGQIWIGTGTGAASYRDGILKKYQLNEKFDTEYAFGFQPQLNAMWMATDRGILRVDLINNQIDGISRANGLPIDKFFQIVIDQQQNFWLTSNRGIIKIAAEQITKVLADQTHQIEYQIFAQGVGLLSSQANGGSNPAATLHTDGTIWVATSHGASQVSYPRLNRVAAQKLPVIIEQLIADGKSYELNNEIKLPAGTSHLAIYYAGLGFLNPKNIKYQTRLLGFDSNWHQKNSQTYTEFTNLGPGQYTFSMRAKYPEGQWSDQVASLTFSIEYYFWQTLIFKLLVVVLLILMALLTYRYRLVKIARNEQRLQQLVANQTIELQQQAQSFAYQATHDQLTNLPNRRAFDSWCDNDFKAAKLNNQTLSLAIIDIDHFKRVNDGYSHIVGDLVIKMVVDLLLHQLSHSEIAVKVARWGGEEFTLLIATNREQAFALCENIRLQVEQHSFDSVAQGLNITISIGLTDNTTIDDYEKMISIADNALYFAKHHGRNQVKIHDNQVLLEDITGGASQEQRKFEPSS